MICRTNHDFQWGRTVRSWFNLPRCFVSHYDIIISSVLVSIFLSRIMVLSSRLRGHFKPVLATRWCPHHDWIRNSSSLGPVRDPKIPQKIRHVYHILGIYWYTLIWISWRIFWIQDISHFVAYYGYMHGRTRTSLVHLLQIVFRRTYLVRVPGLSGRYVNVHSNVITNNLGYHLVMTKKFAMENPNHKWRLLAGKIIYFYGPFSMAMLNNQRV